VIVRSSKPIYVSCLTATETSEPSEHFKKSCRDQAALGGHTARWPPGAAEFTGFEQNLKSTAQIFIRLNHNKPTTDLIFKLSVVFLLHCFRLLVWNAFWDIGWPEYAQLSSDASSGKWEVQVTSGHFDRALREANFELEHVPGLRLTFHKYTGTQVQKSTHKNAYWETPCVSKNTRLLVIAASVLFRPELC